MAGTISAGAVITSTVTSDTALSLSAGSGDINIGSFSWPSSAAPDGSVLTTDGTGNLSFSESNKRVVVTSATYSIGLEDDIVALTVEQASTLTLPDPSLKTVADIIYVVKEVGGNDAITVVPNSTESISGGSSSTVSGAYATSQFYTNGTNWFRLY